jgi:hypothetical protein
MTAQAVEGACAFAWRNCLLLHSGVSENNDRRAALYRYLTRRGDTDEYDFRSLVNRSSRSLEKTGRIA